MNIEKTKKEDLKEIANMRKETIKNVNSEFLPKTDLNVLITMNSHKNLIWRYKYADMYCIKDKKEIIGTIDLYNNEIKGFYVNKNHQGEGVGTKLLDFIEDLAIKKGYKKIRLQCNQSAVGFYLKKGYKIKKKVPPTGKMIKRIIFIMEKKILKKII